MTFEQERERARERQEEDETATEGGKERLRREIRPDSWEGQSQTNICYLDLVGKETLFLQLKKGRTAPLSVQQESNPGSSFFLKAVWVASTSKRAL
jgi:hypothetical protein